MNILDPRFRYVSSYATDLRKTFARVRRESREAKPKPAPERAKVLSLERGRKTG